MITLFAALLAGIFVVYSLSQGFGSGQAVPPGWLGHVLHKAELTAFFVLVCVVLGIPAGWLDYRLGTWDWPARGLRKMEGSRAWQVAKPFVPGPVAGAGVLIGFIGCAGLETLRKAHLEAMIITPLSVSISEIKEVVGTSHTLPNRGCASGTPTNGQLSRPGNLKILVGDGSVKNGRGFTSV